MRRALGVVQEFGPAHPGSQVNLGRKVTMDGWLRRIGRFLGFDRNPLRRPIDRVEARIRVLLTVVLVAGGPTLTIGVAKQVRISVPFGTDRGARVPIWLNDRGQVVTRPLTARDAIATAFLVAVVTSLLLITMLWLIVTGFRYAAIRACASAWEREWLHIADRTQPPWD